MKTSEMVIKKKYQISLYFNFKALLFLFLVYIVFINEIHSLCKMSVIFQRIKFFFNLLFSILLLLLMVLFSAQDIFHPCSATILMASRAGRGLKVTKICNLQVSVMIVSMLQ